KNRPCSHHVLQRFLGSLKTKPHCGFHHIMGAGFPYALKKYPCLCFTKSVFFKFLEQAQSFCFA
ncbi:TPA: hypothetical protein ACNH5B_002644, partial [Enterococcus faecalis]